jgi:hypothetical protein
MILRSALPAGSARRPGAEHSLRVRGIDRARGAAPSSRSRDPLLVCNEKHRVRLVRICTLEPQSLGEESSAQLRRFADTLDHGWRQQFDVMVPQLQYRVLDAQGESLATRKRTDVHMCLTRRDLDYWARSDNLGLSAHAAGKPHLADPRSEILPPRIVRMIG